VARLSLHRECLFGVSRGGCAATRGRLCHITWLAVVAFMREGGAGWNGHAGGLALSRKYYGRTARCGTMLHARRAPTSVNTLLPTPFLPRADCDARGASPSNTHFAADIRQDVNITARARYPSLRSKRLGLVLNISDTETACWLLATPAPSISVRLGAQRVATRQHAQAFLGISAL